MGKGSGDRDQYHIWNAKTHPNIALRQILQELLENSQRPVIERLHELDNEEQAYTYEKQYIQLYGRLDLGTGTLCNRTPGGEGFGNTGTKWTVLQRTKRKSAYLARSPGVGFIQYSLTGNTLGSFRNARELRDAGFSSTQVMAIRKCCRGERYSSGGFRWSYTDQHLPTATTLMKTVKQFTKSGEFVAEFVSVTEASNHTGINQGDIASVARGNTRMHSAGGFVWSYV